MTEETFQSVKAIRNKIQFAKTRVKECMDKENFYRNNPAKADYYSNKVKEWALKLDDLRRQFKEL